MRKLWTARFVEEQMFTSTLASDGWWPCSFDSSFETMRRHASRTDINDTKARRWIRWIWCKSTHFMWDWEKFQPMKIRFVARSKDHLVEERNRASYDWICESRSAHTTTQNGEFHECIRHLLCAGAGLRKRECILHKLVVLQSTNCESIENRFRRILKKMESIRLCC